MEEQHIVHEGSNGIYVFLAFVITIAIVGFLVWRFLPNRQDDNKGGIDINVSGEMPAGNGDGNGSGY